MKITEKYAQVIANPEVIQAMRDWLSECEFADMDSEDFDDLTPAQVVKGVAKFFDGGVEGFLKTI